MPDSVFSNKVTGTSPAPPPPAAPMPPVLGAPAFAGLKANIQVTMPTVDVNGANLTVLTNIKMFWGPSGIDLTSVAPNLFPGSYAPGSINIVEIDVPAYATAYDFEAEVSNDVQQAKQFSARSQPASAAPVVV